MSALQFKKGPVSLAKGSGLTCSPDGSWGLSNAGLVVDRGKSLLIDTLYDVKLTLKCLPRFNRSFRKRLQSITWSIPMKTATTGSGTKRSGRRNNRHESLRRGHARPTPEFMAEIMKNTSTMGDLGRFFYHCFGKFSYDGITSAFLNQDFRGRLDLEIGGKKVELIEVGPCHTKGDQIVIFRLPGRFSSRTSCWWAVTRSCGPDRRAILSRPSI